MNDNNVLVELVDEILKQTSFNNSSEVPPEEATTIGKSITKRDVNEDHVSEAIDTRESSLYLRDVQGSAASTTETAVSRGVRGGNMPCAQLLNFMRHNIVVTAFVVGAILMSLVILLLWFISCIRRRQPLYPPANVTYNIFIMGEKTWWQKNSEKYLSKLCGKAKSLHCNSCI
ncbi:uncharacterized protein C2orf92 homolog [Ochotona curzoniae]|uniref:uncharacterized protein C2orf92 homolog n=1 Tax=Ochotona curzoniae TaxID=130825 RepID=UPI001B34DEEA|nr:uncharacterized protein C2orf92 homolog [Ochotona curzoniae]